MKVTVTITQHELECLQENAELRSRVDPCQSCTAEGCNHMGSDCCDRKKEFNEANNNFDANYSDVDIRELLRNDKISKYYDCLLRVNSCIRRVEEEQEKLDGAVTSLQCALKSFVVE